MTKQNADTTNPQVVEGQPRPEDRSVIQSDERQPVDMKVTITLQEDREKGKITTSIRFDPEVDANVPHHSPAIAVAMEALGFIAKRLKRYR